MADEEYYIEDGDLAELLKEVLGDRISDEDIEKLLEASGDDEISEEDFDNMVDGILKDSKGSNPIDPIKHKKEKGLVYYSSSNNVCPLCGSALLDDFYCANCNLKFSFDEHDAENPQEK